MDRSFVEKGYGSMKTIREAGYGSIDERRGLKGEMEVPVMD